MEEDYYTAYHIVSYKYGEDYPFFPFLVVALYGLLHYYSDYKDTIIKLFQEVDIYIENDSVFNILKKHDIEPFGFDEDEKAMKYSTNATYGVSSRGHGFDVDEEGNTSFVEDPPFIVCSYQTSSMGKLLNTFIHEFSHLIKSQKNSLKIEKSDDIDVYKIRCGLNILCYTYDSSKDMVYELEFFNALDEAINVIQTTDMMQEIASLKEIVNEEEILKLLNLISKDDYHKDFGYASCVKAIRPLWSNSYFKKIVSENIVEGSINSIFEEFDAILGEDSFEYLGDSLDELDDLELKGGQLGKQYLLKRRIQNMVLEYNKKSRKVYQK